MKIKIGKFDFTECWDGVLYKNLSHYPEITDWELQNIRDFLRYEAMNGRTCDIEADECLRAQIENSRQNRGERLTPPPLLTECTACPENRGCRTDFVCHTAPLANALEILSCGKILSAVRARNLPAGILQKEKRNAANDPADYFDYVMLAWGNCQAGDRLVTERSLGRFPTEEELGIGFIPGVRFYFRYADLVKHPHAVFDGVLPLKVRDEISLREWVYCVVAPLEYQKQIESVNTPIPQNRFHFLSREGMDIWQWSESVYRYVHLLGKSEA